MRMWPAIMTTFAFRTSRVASFETRGSCSGLTDRTTAPEPSATSASWKVLPLTSVAVAVVVTFTFRFKPLLSGLMTETLLNLAFLSGFGGGFRASVILATIGSAASFVIISLAETISHFLPVNMGTMWKWVWNTVWPAASPMFDTIFTPSASSAFFTAPAIFCNSRKKVTSLNLMLKKQVDLPLGMTRTWPSAMGNASRMARVFFESKTLKLGISPFMIFAKMLSSL
mmetsp:Transcript_30866/g.82134  ORF Transcript_30866/g.82134 Transcript_30866/m.82134 type:complete len:227 (-) Transcript_30866:79-759(-)